MGKRSIWKLNCLRELDFSDDLVSRPAVSFGFLVQMKNSLVH